MVEGSSLVVSFLFLIMAGMFWNPRGLGEQETKDFIKDAVIDHKLKFVGLQ